MKKFEKKSLPNPRQYDVIPPDMDYIYFQNWDIVPPEPGQTDFSLVNAWWLGECAFLTYCHPGFVRLAYQLAGLDGFRFFGGKGTECMVGWNREAMVVSFRGTELKSRSAAHEIGTDMNTRPVPFEGGGKVHKGFLKGLDEIWEGPEGLQGFLEENIRENPSRPLWMTGHSLGGALATLCFAKTPEATGLYVYGAPRVGDQEFVDQFQGRPVWRIEHGRDPVPLLPPDLPKVDFNFKDAGDLVFISRDGHVGFERPVVTVEEQKSRFLMVREKQVARRNEIAGKIAKAPYGVDNSKRVLEKIGEHVKLSQAEWKDHLAEFQDNFGFRVDDHQPIFYVIKLWNALDPENAC